MRCALMIMLAIVLALPLQATGEGTDMAVDAFIARTGVEADASLREKIGIFLRERFISEPVLAMIDDARLARYAEYLSEDWPIDYARLLEEPSQPMPEGMKPLQLAVVAPQGAAMESMLADFELGRIYYDGSFPVPEDVCRAEYAGTLSEPDAEALLALLDDMTLEDQTGKIVGMELGAIRVAVAWEGGVTRCMAAGEGVSEAFLDSVRALLDAGRAVARGDHL